MPTTYDPIQTYTLGSSAASIDFTSISSSWTDLRFVLTGTMVSTSYVRLRFNSDSATNYSGRFLEGDGTTAQTSSSNSTNRILVPSVNVEWDSSIRTISFDVFSYQEAINKTVIATFSGDLNGSGWVSRAVSTWRASSAITSINLIGATASFAAGTTATLYGIKNA